MQAFRIREDARTWFRDLRETEKSFKIDFDSFYFCFMAGIAAKRKQSTAIEATAELIAYFPEKYSPRGRLLVTLFLARELEFLGVTMDEKRDVHATIAKLVNPDAPNHLSDDGVREFNKYAHGGFDVLLDWFDDRPRTLDSFVRGFKLRIDTELAGKS
jgi:hypothetical protein